MIEVEGEVPRLRRLRKLTQVSRALTSATSLEQVLSLTVAEAAVLLDGSRAALLLYDEAGRLQVRATHAVPESLIDRAAPDASLEELLVDILGDAFHERSVAVPLIVGGKVSGALAVIRGERGIPEDEEEWLLSALADQTMVALEKERLEAIRGGAEHSALVARVGYRLLGQHDIASLFAEVSAAICSTLNVELVGIFGRSEEGPFELLGGAGWPSMTSPASVTRVTSSWEARALRGKNPIAFGATDLDDEITSEGFLRDPRVTSGLVVAIEPAEKNRVIGVYTHASREFSAEESDVVASLAALLSSALEREAAEVERRIAAEMRDDLLAIVSHDLRNPLSAITGAATMLLADVTGREDGGTALRWVGMINRNARRMTTMISDLLDFESLRGGGLSVAVAEHDVGLVLGEIVDMIKPQAEAKSLQLTSQSLAGLKGWFDRDRTLQVLSNLVGNAVKFTAEGGSIVVGADVEAGGEIRVSVRDTGAGIPAEDLAHIFERYWQAKRSDRRGIGLGLSIAKGLVEAQGGRLWVESERGRGTTFFFTIRRE